jgi:hypothetical protein
MFRLPLALQEFNPKFDAATVNLWMHWGKMG